MGTGSSIEVSFTATGDSDFITVEGDFNISLDFSTGSGVGQVDLVRSFDKGATFKPGLVDFFVDDTEKVGNSLESIRYRLTCSSYTSGTIAGRLSF